MGDITISVGGIEKDKDIHYEINFIEIEIPYLKSYEEIKEYCFDIMRSIFHVNNPQSISLLENCKEKIINKNEINGHWGMYQYSLLLKR